MAAIKNAAKVAGLVGGAIAAGSVQAVDLPGRQQDHVYTVREGSRGATGVQGGGCGCN